MNVKLKRGFTLIELLVVIAIIGILASVVLASLNTARQKGRAASAQASLSSLRAQAELGVSSSGTYINDFCNAATGVTGSPFDLMAAATNQGATVTCNDNDTDDATATIVPSTWAVQGDLNSLNVTPRYFCTDSTGFAGLRTTALGVNTACPAT